MKASSLVLSLAITVSACGTSDTQTASLSSEPAAKTMTFMDDGASFVSEGLTLTNGQCKFILPKNVSYSLNNGVLITSHDGVKYRNTQNSSTLAGSFTNVVDKKGTKSFTTLKFAGSELTVTLDCVNIREEGSSCGVAGSKCSVK